jgi:hypothetical protein
VIAPADISFLAAAAAVMAAPFVAWRAGFVGLKWVLGAVIVLLAINMAIAWNTSDAVGAALAGQATAFAIIVSAFLFVAGFCSVAVSGIVLTLARRRRQAGSGE